MKKYLITGIVILMPVALTVMIIFFLLDLFTNPFVNIVGHLFDLIQKHFSFTLSKGSALFISRLLVMILLICFIFILGIVARWFLVKNMISATHQLIARIPIVNSVYKISREIISALFSFDGKKAFHYPVLLPFPKDPLFCIGFSAGQVAEECQEKVGTPLISIFAPTAPHPISGFLFLVPQKEVHPLDMTNEEALKFLVSCGLIYPMSEHEVKKNDIL
jgi:uncharacterized membrane protein